MAFGVSLLEVLGKMQSADISVYQQRCAVVRNRRATCLRCADACTSGALSVHDNKIEVQPELCVGCGTCATVCPTCALEAHRPDDAQLQKAVLQAAAANGGVAVIACKHIVDAALGALDTEKVVAVECLGRVEESLIMALAAAGASRVLLVEGGCGNCERSQGRTAICIVCATARELLETWGCSLTVDVVDRLPRSVRSLDKEFDEGRRAFFFRAKDEAHMAADIAMDVAMRDIAGVAEKTEPRYVKVGADGTLPHFVPDRRRRILQSLTQMGQPEDRLMETRLWGHVEIDPARCDSCQMCATFCPTGAIRKFVEADGTMGVDHVPRDCVACHCCEDICPAEALTVLDEVFAEDLLTGAAERHEMRPPKYDLRSSKKTMTIFRDLLECSQVYDR